MDSCAENKKDLCQAAIVRINMSDRFIARSHIQLTEISPDGTAVGEMEVCPDVFNPLDIVHGGALATLADTVAGSGARIASGCTVLTTNCSMNYLRPATGTKITCIGRPEKLGSRICVMHVDLFNDQNKKVATGDFTFCVQSPPDPKTL